MLKKSHWKCNKENVKYISGKKLLIIGPTGSGKTTMARYLCSKYPDTFAIIKNYTTRERRPDDQDDFECISKEEFVMAWEQGELFLAKSGVEHPMDIES